MSSLAAMLRRLYSSLPSSSSTARLKAGAGSSSGSSLNASPSRGTRGRSKPTRSFLRSSTSSSSGLSTSSPSSVDARTKGGEIVGKGRTHKRRRPSVSTSHIPTHPRAKDYTWQPYPLYPAQFALHRALNPPHMPLPVHKGTLSYTTTMDVFRPATTSSLVPSSDEAQGPFAFPQPHSPIPALSKATSSPLGDHLRVIQTLSHPGLIEGLGNPIWDNSPSEQEYNRMRAARKEDPDAHLVRLLGEAVVRNTLSSGATWEDTLARLGGGNSLENEGGLSVGAEEVRLAKGEEAMKVALDGVNALLAQMAVKDEAAVEDLGVGMDSVRRKRKKKISKHKYKKRRKATRAQRKRLGK